VVDRDAARREHVTARRGANGSSQYVDSSLETL
jgi:hypothetical protein